MTTIPNDGQQSGDRPTLLVRVYRRFVGWQAGDVMLWTVGLSIPFAFLLHALGASMHVTGVIGDDAVLVVMAATCLARRHVFLQDLRAKWWKFALVLVYFSAGILPRYFNGHPGDVYENVAERTHADFGWVEYSAKGNGTAPLALHNAFTVTLEPGATLKVRPSQSQAHPGGYVLQLDGAATLDVGPSADHVSVVTRSPTTIAVLREGHYSVRAILGKDSLSVTPRDVASAANASATGRARVMAPAQAVGATP